ncbi:NAD(P)-dependent oxidoreductase [Alloscardovia omnicolens]|uniref:NAD(P)-dependent oxidoreductase n=1 Tax=Alloscardovia omnicolens TaxID=419015 RepID=UPI003A6E2367
MQPTRKTCILGLLVSLHNSDVAQIESIPGLEVLSFVPIHSDKDEHTPRAVAHCDLLASQLAQCDVIFGWHELLEQAVHENNSRIQWIQLFSAGADYVPLEAMAQAGIHITTASGSNARNIAQQVLAYMLMFMRKLTNQPGESASAPWTLVGGWSELTGKKIVVLGTGEIGREVARLCHSFDMTTVGVNTNGHTAEHFDACVDIAHARSVAGDADFVVNALPLTCSTYHSVDMHLFDSMKHTAYYINVGRGKTTVESDLVQALHSQTIAGAALDVFEVEPLPSDNELWHMPNVICTPHTAGFSDMYTQRVLTSFLDNLESFLTQGRPEHHRLNFATGY